MNENKKHTIECCDSWCKTEGLATYSELLEACKLALHRLEILQDAEEATDWDMEAIDQIKNVISKAEGDL